MPTYTVCFCGTACARDEGENNRRWDFKLKDGTRVVSDKRIYDKDTGYIPVRIHLDISKILQGTRSSVTVRGVGENDWFNQNKASDPLNDDGPLTAPVDLHKYVKTYTDGSDQRTLLSQAGGWGATALALHGANLAATAARSGADVFNFLGHSRGAVSSIMAAWFLYAYGGPYRQIPINIFAIDPVPGTGEWYGTLTQLPPNVRNYVGVYAWDHLDVGFSALVPRPNFWMTQHPGHHKIETRTLGSTWSTLADNCQLDDPLAPNKNTLEQPQGYHLYACRGRHGTVAGIATSDGQYDATKISADVATVPRLVYKLARAYLTQWGTVFQTRCRVREDAKTLRMKIHSAHAEFDAMAGGETRTSRLSGRLSVRRVSSIHGRLGTDKYYLENVVGDPPFKLAYPCTVERSGGGWVKWKFL
ncbi:Tat pathway signal protein [Cystobacter fuscus]